MPEPSQKKENGPSGPLKVLFIKSQNISLLLWLVTYDSATTINGDINWDFEDECAEIAKLNAPN